MRPPQPTEISGDIFITVRMSPTGKVEETLEWDRLQPFHVPFDDPLSVLAWSMDTMPASETQ